MTGVKEDIRRRQYIATKSAYGGGWGGWAPDIARGDQIGLSADSQYQHDTPTLLHDMPTCLGLGMRRGMVRVRGQRGVSCSHYGNNMRGCVSCSKVGMPCSKVGVSCRSARLQIDPSL